MGYPHQEADGSNFQSSIATGAQSLGSLQWQTECGGVPYWQELIAMLLFSKFDHSQLSSELMSASFFIFLFRSLFNFCNKTRAQLHLQYQC